MMNRDREILEAAIVALEAGNDPLSRSFLVDHLVSADECFALADRLALAGRLYLTLIDDLNSDRTKGEAAIALLGRTAARGPAAEPTQAFAARGARILTQIAGDRENFRSRP
jgi:hypothetical protein